MEEQTASPAPETEESEVFAPKPESKRNPGSNKILIPLFFVLLIIVGAGAFFFGSRKTQAPSPTPTATPEETLTPSPFPEGTATPSPKPTKTPSPTPGATSVPATETKTISSTASMDGFRASNGGGNPAVEIRAGRNVNLIMRGFASFDLPGELIGKTIEKATLRLYQTKVVGNPYSVGSALKVDHLDYGSSFENADYSAASLSSSFGTLTANATVEWKDLDVTDQVKADFSAGRTRSQYRFHFAIETIGGDVTGDFAYFESAENYGATGNTPQLVVKYH